MNLPRGIRNNNPLNIRISNNRWRGKIVPSKDPSFEQFENITMGIRAAMVCIRTYMTKYNLRSPRAIIERWAPEKDNNDVQAYINTVTEKARLDPEYVFNFSEKNKVCRLLWAMAYVECGRVLHFGDFENAYELV